MLVVTILIVLVAIVLVFKNSPIRRSVIVDAVTDIRNTLGSLDNEVYDSEIFLIDLGDDLIEVQCREDRTLKYIMFNDIKVFEHGRQLPNRKDCSVEVLDALRETDLKIFSKVYSRSKNKKLIPGYKEPV